VKEYGVFVDLDGIEGMIHVSELTWNRSARPQDVVKVGDEIEAKVLRISGGAKPAEGKTPETNEAHEAQEAHEAHAAHEHADAEAEATAAPDAESATPADVAASAEGDSAHATESAPAADGTAADGAKKAEKKKREPQRRNRGVLEGLPRVVLSRRAIEPDPWAGIDKRFPVGSVHQGKVARMQPFGAFIELEPGIDGLLHVSELGDGKRIEHPNEVLKDGQQVNVRVERVDRGGKRISLSMLPEGVTEQQLKNAVIPRVGMITKGKVAEHEQGGLHVQIEGAIGKLGRGFVTDRESNQPRGTDLRKALPVGVTVTVKVVEIDRGRPKLSIRAALHDEERQAYRAYQKEATSTRVGVSLGDKLRSKLGDLAKK
jgi:ribosomal protein S1